MIESLKNRNIVKRRYTVSNFVAGSAVGLSGPHARMNEVSQEGLQRVTTSVAPDPPQWALKPMMVDGDSSDNFSSSSHLMNAIESSARIRLLSSMPEEESLE
jgi:hypothetical protein